MTPKQPPSTPQQPPSTYQQLQGRLAELTGPALLTVAVHLVLQAQACQEAVAWVGTRESSFYPPDLARAGVDLQSLAVLRLPEARAGPRAAARLLQSGGFGLVVLEATQALPMPLLTRTTGLLKKHRSVLLVLTRTESKSGSLVSWRAHARYSHTTEVVVHVLKDKQQGPGARSCHQVALPAGLRERPPAHAPDPAPPAP